MDTQVLMPANVGFLGAGGVVRTIHEPGFRMCGVNLAAFCDPDPRADLPGVRRCATPGELFQECDAVVIATPNHLHREYALAALAAGKHVLCEKPLALNHAEAREMVAAARGRVAMTAFTYQFTPALTYLRALVRAGDLGEIRTIRGSYLMALSAHLLGWRSLRKLAGSGVLGDIGSHLIHITRYATGEEIASVSATQQRFRDDPASDVEDWIAFLARTKSGACATFEISRVCPGRGAGISEEMSLEVYGTKGSAEFTLQEPWTLRAALGENGRDPSRPMVRLDVPGQMLKWPGSPRDINAHDARWGYRFDQAHAFLEASRAGEARTPSFEDGARCQAVMDAALASCESGQWTEVAE